MGRLLQLEARHRMESLHVRLMVKLEAGHGDLAETSTSNMVNGQSASQRCASLPSNLLKDLFHISADIITTLQWKKYRVFVDKVIYTAPYFGYTQQGLIST